MQHSFEEFKHITSPHSPSPGLNRVTTFGVCTHPKARRSAFLERLKGSALMLGFAFGHRRSGVVHTSIGEGVRGGSTSMGGGLAEKTDKGSFSFQVGNPTLA